jgi:hypothetical protein
MRVMIVVLAISCAACVDGKSMAEPSEVMMTTGAQGNECLVTLNGQRFATQLDR